ncbi:MAG: YceI family protein, partial [Gemmatimonadaceae bacterium]
MTTEDGASNSRFVIDTGLSRFTVRAFASGLLSAFGHSPTFAVRDYSGEVTLNPAAIASASLTLKAKAASLSLVDDVSQSDRRAIEKTMQDEVLDSAQYPEIAFVSEKISVIPDSEGGAFHLSLSGKLTLHGITHNLTIPARVTLGDNELRAFGEFTIPQSKFGIKPVSVGGSMLKV